MPERTPPLNVRVPASTSNLGPGFDLLGLALSLELEVRVERRVRAAAHEWLELGGEAASWSRRADDRLLLGFDRAAAVLGLGGHYAFSARSEIPVSRGFGSSGAATAAGLLLARALAGRAVPLEQLLPLGIAIEGHPDNVTAALFGGCTLCHPDAGPRGAPLVVRQAVHPSIGFALAWPDSILPTEQARAALPHSVPFRDAVENPRRLALLLEGLRSGDPMLLAAGIEDRLHERHRLPLLPGARQALEAGRAAGAWAAPISGSGSGLAALAPRDRAGPIAAAMAAALRECTGAGQGRAVELVGAAPRVTNG
jgi:homoserine kinase